MHFRKAAESPAGINRFYSKDKEQSPANNFKIKHNLPGSALYL